MQLLERVHLVQFFLFEAQTLEFDATTAIIAPNGAGKSAVLDALQIVLMGGDRSRIRFNAQAGGSSRARTIRNYCLGTYRSDDEGRKRRTATTYVSLVFRDPLSGQQLTAGIALGANVDEPEHRVYGLYLLPDVALSLEQHLERQNGRELPLDWAAFREVAQHSCRQVGSKLEIHNSGERFLKDLLYRLRPGPTTHIDLNAYRKAFQNALNLQRVDDVDLFVRTLVAEDRPTDIGRFRGLLESFRLIKEKIEEVVRRIDAAQNVEQQYARIAAQAARVASYHALSAEYARDLLSEQVDAAERALGRLQQVLQDKQRQLQQARSDRDVARSEHTDAANRWQSSDGYGEQAQFDALASRDRDRLAELKKDLLRNVAEIRSRLQAVAALDLPGIDTTKLAAAIAPWEVLYLRLSALASDAEIGLLPDQIHADATQTAVTVEPMRTAIAAYVQERQGALQKARERVQAARYNQARHGSGQAELHADVIRLMSYLQQEGIATQPICDLVRVADVTWQPALEAYLRSHVEALLIPAEQEEAAVRLYRALRGGRSVYGVKLALSSQTHAVRGVESPPAGSAAALLTGDNAAALAYLRRQLGDLRCVDAEAELVRTRQGLTSDGLLAKGGSIERLRLPGSAELKIGVSSNRERLRVLHDDLASAERDIRLLEPQARQAEMCLQRLARLATADNLPDTLHALILQHREAEGRYRSLREGQIAARAPDLIRLSERIRELQERVAALDEQVEKLAREEGVADQNATGRAQTLAVLQAQQEAFARRAVDAFSHPDTDPNLVERQRDELEKKFATLEDRRQRCDERAGEVNQLLQNSVPDAWSLLAQYAKDHGLVLDFVSSEWRAARKLLQKELAHLHDTELAHYQIEADRAYATAVETFRANVASALYDNFSKLKYQINTLNRTLRSSPAFSNNERYQFHYEVAAEFRELHRFIQRAADLGAEDGLFGTAGEVPEAFRDIIESRVSAHGMISSPLDDYRRFFNFEVQIRQDDRVVGTLSDRMRSGSGGEHRAPLYVIAGAALAAAYGKNEIHQSGIGLILLDEFGDKIDAQNARATTNYLRSLGLQLVLAAPDTAQGTLTGVLDSYLELFRDGDLLQLERVEITEEGRELLRGDQFDLRPELLLQEVGRIENEKTGL